MAASALAALGTAVADCHRLSRQSSAAAASSPSTGSRHERAVAVARAVHTAGAVVHELLSVPAVAPTTPSPADPDESLQQATALASSIGQLLDGLVQLQHDRGAKTPIEDTMGAIVTLASASSTWSRAAAEMYI